MAVQVVARTAELGLLTAFLDVAATRPAGLVWEGAPGIGKTTLWRAGVDRARARGWQLMTARPGEHEVTYAYATLADLLAAPEEELLTGLPPLQARALDAVLLRGPDPAGPVDPHAVGAAFLTVLRRLAAAGPVLLALDDLQWVDASSSAAIGYALRRVQAPVGVLGALRSGPRAPRPTWLDRSDTTRVQLAPLDAEALHDLLVRTTGHAVTGPVLRRIDHDSGGNPMLALELAAAARRRPDDHDPGLPGTLLDLVRDRLEDLPERTRTVLLLAALTAAPTTGVLTRAAAGNGLEVGRALEDAEDAGVVTVTAGRVAFTHPLLASGTAALAPPGERRSAHVRLAAVVVDPEERARHLALASLAPDPATVRALDAAATRARARGAPAAAAELVELALQRGGDTVERRITLSRHRFDAGEPEVARRVVEDLLPQLPGGAHRAEALRVLAVARLHDDSYAEAAALLHEALQQPHVDGEARVRILVQLVYVLVNVGRIAEARHLGAQTVEEAEALGHRHLLALALAGSTMVALLAGEGLERAALARAVALEDAGAPTPVMLRPLLISALALGWVGELAEAHEQLLAVRQGCLERGEESDLMFVAFHLVVQECSRGDFAAAGDVAEDAARRADQLGTEVPRAIALTARAAVAAHAGDTSLARASAEEALRIFSTSSCLAVMVWPSVTLGFLDVSLGDHAAAAATLGPLAQLAAQVGYGEPTAAPFAADAAEALVGTGQLVQAQVLVDRLEADGARLDRPWAKALGARCRALLLAARGDLAGAQAAAERALVEHDRLPMPLERARTLLVLGQVVRRRRHQHRAAELVEEALAEFERLGAAVWAHRARGELARTSAPRVPPGTLTAAEQRTAELAASGMTVAAVAEALFLSPKTVQAHLTGIYRKLGIHTRAELARRVG